MTWTDAKIAQLRAEWATGLSSRLIGRKLGMSKGAVVSKANRIGLPERPSPIKHGRAAPPLKSLPRGALTLPALASLRDEG